jgi:hypothetical protein
MDKESVLAGAFDCVLSTDELAVASLIATSMDSKLSLHLEYDGEPRLVEVHALGVSKAGKPCFRGYQVAGGSNSGEFEGWKMFSLGKVSQMPKLIYREVGAPREGYQRGDKGMVQIVKEL